MSKGPSYPLSLRSSVQSTASFLYTLFLFIKNDYLLVVAPTVLSGIVLAPPADVQSFLAAWLWMNLHLLAFNIQNQLTGVEEDRLCKPFRPFPSGRLSLESGRILYIAVVAACFAWSFQNDLVLLTSIYTCGTWAYNELGLAANPFLKTPMGGIAYICYGLGTTFILGMYGVVGHFEPLIHRCVSKGHHRTLNEKSLYAILTSGLIFGLTGHMQDFRDRSGDALLGRRTIPLILPQGIARWSLLVIISTLTYILVRLWSPPVLVTWVFSLLTLTTAVTLVGTHSEEADRINFRWYEVWLIYAHLLPLYRRIADGEVNGSGLMNLNVVPFL